MKIGYIIASHQVMTHGKPIGYCYREKPDGPEDSGWRVFSGEESQEYADDPNNFSMYNASTVVDLEPAVSRILGTPFPVTFERDARSDRFVQVDEDEG
ncbi:MAG: DUF2185 domain-containing protein [Nannocystaceae bacterium]|nr:DUF2185 domain-containing protein [Nannocystaceae bacterium]